MIRLRVQTALRATFVMIVLTTVITVSPLSQSEAQVACPTLLFGQIKPNFKHNTKYTVEIPQTAEIKDQCSLGTCHLQSWTAQLEVDYQQRTGKKIALSTEYLAARHWEAKSLKLLDSIESLDETVDVTLGASMTASKQAIATYGLMPASSWKAGTLFQSSANVSKLQSYLTNIIARAKWMISQEPQNERRQEILDEGRRQIRSIFRNFLGALDEEFEFEGQKYTAKSFLASHFSQINQKTVTLLAHRDPHKTKTYSDYSSAKFIDSSIQDIEKVAKALLDQGIPVYLSYHHNSAFVDSKTGIMSIKAFHTPAWAAPLQPEQATYFDRKVGGHAVQIIGYDLDPKTHKILKWKIQNSWGEKMGDKGIYHMYSDYFQQTVLAIGFFENSMIFLPEAPVRGEINRSLF